jgi:hypothetical protein
MLCLCPVYSLLLAFRFMREQATVLCTAWMLAGTLVQATATGGAMVLC